MIVGIDIATLGPSGTDSEAAAQRILKDKCISGEIVLCENFEAAKNHAIENNSYFLIPTAYISRNNGDIVESWGDFNFRCMNELQLEDAIVLPLKEICIARNKYCSNPQSIALHPATEIFVENGLRRDYVHSKPLAVEQCSKGLSDRCIGSVDVVERFDSLEIEKRFCPDMIWALYSRR